MDRVAEYSWLARTIASAYFLPGGDESDVVQEAMIGLWNADRDYDPARSSFIDFARLCIHRQLFTALTASRRMKHAPLSHSVRESTVDGLTVDAVDMIVDVDSDPADVLERRDRFRHALEVVASLSPLERHAAVGVSQGRSFRELADEAGVDVKAIDNARFRAKEKYRLAA